MPRNPADRSFDVNKDVSDLVDWYQRTTWHTLTLRVIVLASYVRRKCSVCPRLIRYLMTQSKPRILVWSIVAACLAIQVFEFGYVVHRESLTFDEANHMFAGYMMWKTRDFGLNPEHPPLVKLLATAPLLHQDLWVPPLQGREFKQEAYLDGRDWLAANDGSSQRLVFRMRLSAGLLVLALSVIVFLAARPGPNVVPRSGAQTILVFHDVETNAVFMRKLRTRILAHAGIDRFRFPEQIAEAVDVVNAHVQQRQAAIVS